MLERQTQNAYVMKKLLIVLSLTLCCATAFPQREGFFNVYEQAEKSFCASAAIETDDSCLIIAVYDYYGGRGELKKISQDGVLLKTLPIGNDDVFSGVVGLYRDPWHTDAFYAIGHFVHFDEQISKPFVMHFSEELELLYLREVELPGECPRSMMQRSLFTSENDFLFAISLRPEHAYHRWYMRIALDGTLTKFHEETEDCGSGIWINAIFEFPEGNRFGEYRNSYQEPGYLTLRQRLFGFNDDFVFDTLHEYGEIIETLGDTVHSISNNAVANGTVRVFNDSILLFSDRALEVWRIGVATYETDRSTLFFSSDLEGNIKNYLVIGSKNNSAEVPISFNAIDIDKKGQGVYHGCFSLDDVISFPFPNRLVITKTDDTLGVIWEKAYSYPSRFLEATYLFATNDGGCVVTGGAYDDATSHYDLFVLKINADGTMGTDEFLVQDNLPYTYYPNPAHDQLRLQYSPDVQPAQVELYDLQGRLVRTQHGNFEHIDIHQLPAGTYTMRVIMEDGKSYSDKVVKE